MEKEMSRILFNLPEMREKRTGNSVRWEFCIFKRIRKMVNKWSGKANINNRFYNLCKKGGLAQIVSGYSVRQDEFKLKSFMSNIKVFK